MGKRLAAIVGTISGILMVTGILLEWFMSYRLSLNGISFLTAGENGIKIGPEVRYYLIKASDAQAMALLTIVGSIIVLVVSVLSLILIILKRFKHEKFFSYLILIGGILSIIGGGWAYVEVGRGTLIGATGVPGLGLYILIISGLIALKSSFDLKAKD